MWHWCFLQEHSISSWNSSDCECCRVQGLVCAFCFLSVLSPWWGVAKLFCTFSVWHLWAISRAQFNSELTGALGDAVAYTRAQGSSSKPARAFQSVSGTSLAICLQLLGLFGKVIQKRWGCAAAGFFCLLRWALGATVLPADFCWICGYRMLTPNPAVLTSEILKMLGSVLCTSCKKYKV